MSKTFRHVVVTISHHSCEVPLDILAEMLGDAVGDPAVREARRQHLFREGDPYTDLLFHLPGAQHVGALVSRFVVDLNRPRHMTGENGTIKLRDFTGGRLYPDGFELDPVDAEERLQRFWDPFNQSVSRALRRDRARFFVDAHAMMPTGPTIGPDSGASRPAFNVITGGDLKGEAVDRPTSVPGWLARQLVDVLWSHFGDLLDSVPEVRSDILINSPFAIGNIQSLHGHPEGPSRKPGFGLEFNRALYLRDDDRNPQQIDGRLTELNTRLRAFVAAITPLFERGLAAEGAP